MLEFPIAVDVALINAEAADRWGNLVYRKTARNFAPVMAMAATTTIAAVRRVCELGELDPETVVTPGIFVKRVVLRDGVPPAAEPAARVPAVVPAGVAINTWGGEAHGPSGKKLWRARGAISAGAYVNLGIGLPTLVANHPPKHREVILHRERRARPMVGGRPPGQEDWDLINAGKEAIRPERGAAFSTMPTPSA